MGDIEVEISSSELGRFQQKLEEAAANAARSAIRPVFDRVVEMTPVWKGTLRENTKIREEDGGKTQVIYNDSPYAKAHESGGTRSSWPPPGPIEEWVHGKLGITGKEARGVAFMIARKIAREGLTIPNQDNLGRMFERTMEDFSASREHVQIVKDSLTTELEGV